MKKWNLFIIIGIALIIIGVNFIYPLATHFDRYGIHGIGSIDKAHVYSNSGEGFTILVPDAWHIQEIHAAPDYLSKLIIVMNTRNIRAGIEISKLEEPANTRASVVDYMERSHKQLADFVEISTNQITLGKHSGDLLEYTFISQTMLGSYTSHCYDWIIAGKNGFDFTFCIDDKAWEAAQPMFMRMIGSIEIE